MFVCTVQTNCNNVVDKYTEYDNVIICLDALLHKSQAYRHLLFNAQILVSFPCWIYMHHGKQELLLYRGVNKFYHFTLTVFAHSGKTNMTT